MICFFAVACSFAPDVGGEMVGVVVVEMGPAGFGQMEGEELGIDGGLADIFCAPALCPS